jgi:hypothetical protein
MRSEPAIPTAWYNNAAFGIAALRTQEPRVQQVVCSSLEDHV